MYLEEEKLQFIFNMPTRFMTSSFFHYSNLLYVHTWATDQRVKEFFILVKTLPSYSNVKFEKNDSPKDRPWRVNLPCVSDPGEIESPYDETQGD